MTLAHLGVLFLDELAEFDRDVLDALRQPLEDGTVEIVRAHGSMRYPARLQLVAATNPCRCGWYGDPVRRCTCPTGEAERYARKVSGPLLDRIDLQVPMARVDAGDLIGGPEPESSALVAPRIARARWVAMARNSGVPNARLPGAEVLRACALTPAASTRLRDIAGSEALSARSLHRVLRVARTVADLRDAADVGEADLLAALSLRREVLPRGLAA